MEKSLPAGEPAFVQSIVTAMVSSYYSIVDDAYKTFCVINSEIISNTLSSFQIPNSIEPCQLFCTSKGTSFIVGFVGLSKPGQWDGHLVVVTQNFLIDCSTGSLREHCGVAAPFAVATSRVNVPSSLLARLHVEPNLRLGWLAPPRNANCTPPLAPHDLVDTYVRKLTTHVREVTALRPQ